MHLLMAQFNIHQIATYSVSFPFSTWGTEEFVLVWRLRVWCGITLQDWPLNHLNSSGYCFVWWTCATVLILSSIQFAIYESSTIKKLVIFSLHMKIFNYLFPNKITISSLTPPTATTPYLQIDALLSVGMKHRATRLTSFINPWDP